MILKKQRSFNVVVYQFNTKNVLSVMHIKIKYFEYSCNFVSNLTQRKIKICQNEKKNPVTSKMERLYC